MNEIWREICGYEGYYQISNLGRIRSLSRTIIINGNYGKYIRNIKGKILSVIYDKDGYQTITLSKDGKEVKHKIHRLVAITFIPNPNNYKQVNHINGIKSDNCYLNLEWCDNAYNQIHAYKNGLKTTNRIACIDLETNKIIKIFPSLPSIKNELNVDLSTVIKVCKNKRNKHKGYKWKYATSVMKVGDVID